MDLTVTAVPGYFGSMGAEYRYLKRRAELQGPSAADYERHDTVASLAMGVASLFAPLVLPKLLAPITPGKGKYGKALVATALGAVVVTTVADLLARLDDSSGEPAVDDDVPTNRAGRRKWARLARKVARVGSVAAVVAGGAAITTTLASKLTPDRMWKRRVLPDWGTGPVALASAVLAWDFIYYWNHRFMHESRYMWAIHVVHHSSERYNLSTALRQPVADVVGTFLPYGALCILGIRPEMIASARGVNLLYQYWIHTDAIRSIGPFETVLNTPSHHRVHHGSNPQYLDRNHGSILIVWYKLFDTFEPERDEVVYGLTKNINTFAPARIATHEHADILRDVAASDNWPDRLSFVIRGPGWAYQRHAERDASIASDSSRRGTHRPLTPA